MRRAIPIVALCVFALGCKLKATGSGDGGVSGDGGGQNGDHGDGGTTGTSHVPVVGAACHQSVSKAAGACALQAGTYLPSPRTAAPSATVGSTLVIAGGQTSGPALADTTLASVIGQDGTPGGWQTATIPAPHPNAALATVGSNIYLVGGEVAHTVTGSTDVVLGHVGDAAAITFEATMPLAAGGVTKAAAAATATHLYVIGGRTSGGSADQASVYIAALDSDGKITGYQRGPSLPEGRSSASAAVVNGYLYVVGGFYAKNSDSCSPHQVLFAKVNDDGTLGSWTATTSLPAAPIGAVLVAGANRLYLVGGITSYGDTKGGQPTGSILAADLNSDGSLGAWSRVGAMPDQRYGHAAAIVNGKLLVFGGLTNGNTVMQDGWVATVKSDGSLSCP